MIFSLELIDWQKWFVGGFRSLMYSLDETVYTFVMDLYNIFRWICGARVADNAIMNELATRVGFILGLLMFFYISFDFIQVLLDPDKLTDKDKGPLNIIKKFLIVIVLLGTSRYIFDLMYNFQNIVLSSDDKGGSIIEKLILPYSIKTENFGAAISSNFMREFYTITDDPKAQDPNVTLKDTYDYSFCETFANLLPDYIVSERSFQVGYECLNERYVVNVTTGGKTVKSNEWFIKFNPLLSVAVGVFVMWILMMYCISVGIRVIQLILLQIVSPAAIICYLSPKKENTFTKWAKLYFSTYVDVFIRIAIINFIVLLSGLILDTNSLSSDSGVIPTSGMTFWIKVFMVIALLSFAKKFPDLIKKLLPDSMQSGLGFGISAKDRYGAGVFKKAFNAAMGGAIAAGTGLVGGIAGSNNWKNTLTGEFGGIFGGLFRGGLAGAKGKSLREAFSNARKNQSQANLKRAQRIASGATLRERAGDKVKDIFGMQSGYSEVDSKLAAYENLNSLIDSEDIVKDYEAQRVKANEALGKAQRDYDAGLIGNDDLNRARDAYLMADARKKAAREAVWTANQTGQTIQHITYTWTNSVGVTRTVRDERAMDAAKGNNGSIHAAMETVARVGKTYPTREAFNIDRKNLQGESNKYHKNG